MLQRLHLGEKSPSIVLILFCFINITNITISSRKTDLSSFNAVHNAMFSFVLPLIVSMCEVGFQFF